VVNGVKALVPQTGVAKLAPSQFAVEVPYLHRLREIVG
jgi:hypothetical protein